MEDEWKNVRVIENGKKGRKLEGIIIDIMKGIIGDEKVGKRGKN